MMIMTRSHADIWERAFPSPEGIGRALGGQAQRVIGVSTILRYTAPAMDCLDGRRQHDRRYPTGHMIENDVIDDWFCREVLPLERSLTYFIRRNWRVADDVIDLRHDIYELALAGARNGLPTSTKPFVFTIARHHLINCAKRARIVSFDLVADLEAIEHDVDLFAEERHLTARDTLRQVQAGMERLSPRVREIVHLRKFEGLDTQETADQLGIGIDAVKQQLRLGMQALTDFMLGGSGKIVRPRLARRRDRRSDP